MRKAKPKKRILLPDPKYGDVSVTRFVNNLMLDGKKSIAYEIFYDAIDIVGEKMKDADKAPLDIWRKALENVTPQVEVKSRRVGGATFQVPTEVRPERKVSLSMKNMILFARKRPGHSMAEKLANEAPVKIILPIVLFIFPAVMLILLIPLGMKVFALL